MEERKLICIGCPLGCPMTVTLNDAGEVEKVTGFTCRKGDIYARKEVVNPTRTVTSTVKVTDAKNGERTVSCKTKTDVPKSKIFDVMRDLRNVTVKAPIHIGDVVKENVGGTVVDMVATKEVL
jgi:CxxC motif-containing protein